MATGFDDLGASGNWTADRDATASSWTFSANVLSVSGNSVEGLTLNAVDSEADRGDIDCLIKVTAVVSLTSTPQYACFVRGSTGGSGPYRYAVRMGGGFFRTYKYVNSTSPVQISTVTTANFNAVGDYWVRLNVTGSTVRARIWKDGTNEPTTWSANTADNAAVTGTDTAVTGVGWAGVQSTTVASSSIHWSNGFGWGTNGDTAPAAGASGVPTLSLPTYMPGSLTSTGFRPRVTAT